VTCVVKIAVGVQSVSALISTQIWCGNWSSRVVDIFW
jgi:hypothetical protein